MKPVKPQPPLDASKEISALIETLHSTGQRLEELTAGEVDAVANREGRTFVLRHVQEQFRDNEAARQTAILNALPAHIALLDGQGRIVSVNRAWQRFADAHAPQRTECGVGANYLAACDNAQGDDAACAQQAAAGIRALQNGAASHFSMEYPCHSPTRQRWFLMTASPLADEPPTGVVVMHLDITDRKQAEQELRESERRFSDLLGNIKLVAMMLDREARITYCNDFLLHLTGWQREEVIGRNWFDLFMPPELNDLKGIFFSDLLSNLPDTWHNENEILTRSGERRLIRWNNSVLRSGDGAVSGTASIGEDITEQKRTQQALTKLQRQSALILESLEEGIYGMDLEGRMTFQNPAAAKMLGYPSDELIGRPAHTMMHYARRDGTPFPKAQCPIHITLADGVVRKIEDDVFWRKDGVSVQVEYTTAPIHDEQGAIVGGVVAFRDVTSRKQREQVLRESERVSTESRADAAAVRDIAIRLQAILDTVGDGVITIDEFGKVETFNPPAELIFGYAAGEVIGRNVSMLIPEPYLGEHAEYLANHRSASAVRFIGTRREVVGLHKDGGTFPLDLSISEMTLGGERHYTEAIRDITERKAAERAVVAARIEAERANTAKNTFLANMSHEIRTPMNGVIGMIEVLQQSSLNGPQMEMANIIRDSSFALLDVINDILDFSKIESGKLEIDHIPIRVADVVEKACGILKRMALKKKVELTLFIDPAIPEQVMGDPGRLRQILINLTNNAIKFSSATSRPGLVSVRALLVESDRLEFQIADNGIGLDEDSLARIFAPFVQADVSTTRKYGGTGLGLVISRQLAKLMGGDIRVSSAPGVGSLFSVSLPLELPPDQARDHASEPNAPAAAKAPTAPLSGETVQRRDGRILVAEDNEINQNVILHQLALLGYVADLADDGREALARWHQGNHALLLTDLQMPNMDGYELTAAIRRTEADDQHLPIVALTANALKSEELRCKAAGMDDYLTKPVLLDQLQATLEKWLPIPGQGEIAGDSADAVVAALPESPLFAVLDRTVLAKQIGNDPALIAQFFKDYQRSAQKAAGEIRAAIALGNWKTAGDGAHKLKSSSRAVGALALGEVCHQLEQAGKEGHADAALLLAAEFENALAAVLDAMNH